jgi:hypothetical protein
MALVRLASGSPSEDAAESATSVYIAYMAKYLSYKYVFVNCNPTMWWCDCWVPPIVVWKRLGSVEAGRAQTVEDVVDSGLVVVEPA